MLPRFFVPDLHPGSPTVTLPKEESHHLYRVLRLRVGDEVVVFDGREHAFRAQVAAVAGDQVKVTLLEPIDGPAQPGVTLALVQCILKSDAMDDVVRDSTMVGVETIQPIISDRTTVKASRLPTAVERWRRIALAAAKQCGRIRLPTIHEVLSLEQWVRGTGVEGAFLLVEPAVSVPNTITIRDLAHRPPQRSSTLIIGPEGGWTPRERDLAIAAGCTPLSLGRLTLRADAVPLAVSAALISIWDG